MRVYSGSIGVRLSLGAAAILLASGAAMVLDSSSFAGASPSPAQQPTVSAVTPNVGPVTGGQGITIYGSGFSSDSTVSIGQGNGADLTAIPAADVVVDSSGQISATTGGGAKKGVYNVFVTNVGGSSPKSSGDQYTYQGPEISAVTPNVGPVTGGQNITIYGSGFASDSTVSIGQGHGATTGAIAATNVVVVSAGEITATTGSGAKVGDYNVFVTTKAGVSPSGSTSSYTYQGPRVSAVTPNVGPVTGGQDITIYGSGFASDSTVMIGQGNGPATGAIAATNVVVVSAGEITATTGGGAKAGTHEVFVTTSAGVSPGGSAGTYTYQ